MSIEFYARVKQGWIARPNFEVMQFPGGEQYIKNHDTVEYVEHFAIVRGADANDLVLAAMWVNLVAKHNCSTHLFVPYIPGARDDKGDTGGNEVYASMIASVRATDVTFVDLHSDVSAAELTFALGNTNKALRFQDIVSNAVAGRSELRPGPYDAVIAPDKGAVDRAKLVADRLGVPVYFATKSRDPETGKLTNFKAPEDWMVFHPAGKASWKSVPEGRYLVVDDICDGGGTFMGLASVLKLPRERLDLWVTHGVFSGNAGQLTQAYGNVYTTDSHPGAYNEKVGARVTKLLPYFLESVRN